MTKPFSEILTIAFIPKEIVILCFAWCSFLITLDLSAQDEMGTLKGSPAIFLQLYGPEILGLHINYNISNHFSANTGIGLNADFHIGSNYYITKRKLGHFSIYSGFQLISYHEFSYSGSSGGDRQNGLYIPVGFEYVAHRGFTMQLDIGPNFYKYDYAQRNTVPFFGSLKIGITFLRK
ncbi:MAG: hypothetical protein KBA14_01940 [Saprospiraceae bacterium]|nr:hypothetical protein [Saprospiraceae bacterium]